MNEKSRRRRVLQRVPEPAARVVHEHVVERRALHRERLDRDAGGRRHLEKRARSSPVRCWCVMRNTASCRDTPSTCGSASRRACQPSGTAENVTSSRLRPGNRRLQHRRRIERLQLAMVHDRDVVAEPVGLVHVVRRDEHGELALLLDVAQHLPHRHARHRIEAGGRLVEKEHARLVDEPARDLHAPPHAAREILDLLVGPLRQLDRLEQFADEAVAALARHAVELRVDEQILAHAEFEIARHRLRNDANRATDAVRNRGRCRSR